MPPENPEVNVSVELPPSPPEVLPQSSPAPAPAPPETAETMRLLGAMEEKLTTLTASLKTLEEKLAARQTELETQLTDLLTAADEIEHVEKEENEVGPGSNVTLVTAPELTPPQMEPSPTLMTRRSPMHRALFG